MARQYIKYVLLKWVTITNNLIDALLKKRFMQRKPSPILSLIIILSKRVCSLYSQLFFLNGTVIPLFKYRPTFTVPPFYQCLLYPLKYPLNALQINVDQMLNQSDYGIEKSNCSTVVTCQKITTPPHQYGRLLASALYN